MALPPTPFTMLLAEAVTPAAIYEILRRARFLSKLGRQNPDEVVAFISHQHAEIAARYNSNERICGPSSTDYLASALATSPYLNDKGRTRHLPEVHRKTFLQRQGETLQSRCEQIFRRS